MVSSQIIDKQTNERKKYILNVRNLLLRVEHLRRFVVIG
jgi:hypothetical protein